MPESCPWSTEPTGSPPRLSVYLTNSLEEGEPANETLPFAKWLSREAKGANTVKRDTPIMCVIGNPPYLGEGGVSEGWLGDLMDDYKKEPGGKVDLLRFDAAPLIAFTATKETDYGTETDRRISPGCGADRADKRANA